MKVPLPNGQLLSLDAPTVLAIAVRENGTLRWKMWCKYCEMWHSHGPGEGHREAHCNKETPYVQHGYNLAATNTW